MLSSKKIWMVATSLTLIALLLVAFKAYTNSSTWNSKSHWDRAPSYEELWVVKPQVLTNPFSTRPRDRYNKAKEIEGLIEDIIKKEHKHTSKDNLSVDRRFNSSILYLSSKTQTKLDWLYDKLVLETNEPIGRIYLTTTQKPKSQAEDNQISSESEDYKSIATLSQPLLIGLSTLTTLGIASILLLIIRNSQSNERVKAPYIIVSYCLAAGVALSLNHTARLISGQTTKIETKVVNTLAPHNKNYMHLYALSTLKSLVGETTLALLEKEGYQGGIEILNEEEIFNQESKKNKANSLWISSTAEGKKIAKTKIDAEKLIKNLLVNATEKKQENQKTQEN